MKYLNKKIPHQQVNQETANLPLQKPKLSDILFFLATLKMSQHLHQCT